MLTVGWMVWYIKYTSIRYSILSKVEKKTLKIGVQSGMLCTIKTQNESAIPTFQIFLNIQMSNTDSMTIPLFNPFLFLFNIKNLSSNPRGYEISLPFTLYF